jgi:hypothetical protein
LDLSELYRSSFATFKATSLSARYSLDAFSLFLWRWLAILNLTRRNIDDELGELGGIAGAFAVAAHFSCEPGLPASQSSLLAISFRAFFFLDSFARSVGELGCFKRFWMSFARFL